MIGVRPVGTHGVLTLVSAVQLEYLIQGQSQVCLKKLSSKVYNEEDDVDVDEAQNCLPLTQCHIDSDHDHEYISVQLPEEDQERLKRASDILKQRLLFRLWLDDHGLLDYAAKFTSLGVNSIEDTYWFEDLNRLEESVGQKIVPIWVMARQSLPSAMSTLENLKASLWNRIIHLDQESVWSAWGTLLLVTLSVTGFGVIAALYPRLLDAKDAVMRYVSKQFSLAAKCQVNFDWKEPAVVGQTVSFTIRFFQRGGRPYPVCDGDNILLEVKKDSRKVALATTFGGQDPEDVNLVVVKFSVREAGSYFINILVENNHIRGSPFIKKFLPGKIDPAKTLFIKQTSTVVCVVGQQHKLWIKAKDSYGNGCRAQDFDLNLFSFSAFEIQDGKEKGRECTIQTAPEMKSGSPNANESKGILEQLVHNISKETGEDIPCSDVSMTATFPEPGVFKGALMYNEKRIQNGDFEVLVLSHNEAEAVQRNVVAKRANAYYEGKLLRTGSEEHHKPRKVYLSVTAKQVVIKEYFLKFLPMRIATFRLSPNTKLQFLSTCHHEHGIPTIIIDDGSQPSLRIAMKDAKIIVATFTHFLLRNIGGSETFGDKQNHFFKELRDFHRKHSRDKLLIKVTREQIVESTWQQTKGLSVGDWCRNFEITFINEQGIDWGGVRREWFELVCSRMFEAGNPVGMFTSFGESRLVHPNPNTKWKPKHYEMAGRIVGKCLYESSLGSAYRQMVKAHFTRSFLAQLIGLRVNYKHFEQDDPELYMGKVKYILENDVEPMDLTFIEEEYDPLGKLSKTVDLISDGSKTKVTNENKREYLNALADYKLASKMKNEVGAFIKGLNDLVPDELLTIFDENELELLMCGTSEYSVTELRENHVVGSGNSEFRKVLDWFWTAVSNMTEEEKARLLQFTTGCSLLPPGGFRELSPLFEITASPNFGSLPTAHTCFNQLCLPDYDSYETFEKSLRIAINEGSEGFGLV